MGAQSDRRQGAFELRPQLSPRPGRETRRRRLAGALLHVPAVRRRRDDAMAGVPAEKRALVAEAIRSGRLLHDPDDARLVLLVTERGRPKTRRELWTRRLSNASVLAFLGYETYVSIRGNIGRGVSPAAASASFAWLAFQVGLHQRGRERRHRLRHAYTVHRSYLEQLGEPLLPATKIAASVSVREPRAPHRGAVALLFASVFLVGVPTAAPSSNPSAGWIALALAAAVAATACAAAAAPIGVRSWRRWHGFKNRLEAGLIVLIGGAVAVGWIVGLVAIARRV